jgi:hypothetical protein
MAHTACFVCLISAVSGRSKKTGKIALERGRAGSRHLTKLEQSRFSLDIYGCNFCSYVDVFDSIGQTKFSRQNLK